MKKPSFRKLALVVNLFALAANSNNVFATASQTFTGINYSNPAFLGMTVKNYEALVGDDWVFPGLKFEGDVFIPDPLASAGVPPAFLNNLAFSGEAHNRGNYFLPYGRLAKRFTPQLIGALEITTPFAINVSWPDDSIAAYNATQFALTTTDISPMLIYNFGGKLDKLTIGVGPDFLHFSGTTDNVYPSLPTMFFPRSNFGAGPNVAITEHFRGWAYGWHAGLTYRAALGTILGLSYFSQFQNDMTGTSTFTGFPNNDNLSVNVRAPATSNISLTQFFSKEWLVQAQVFYSQWNTNKTLIYNNTAGTKDPALLPLNYNNTWRYNIRTRYELNPKWAFGATLAYDETPTNNTDRNLGLPESNLIEVGVNGEYHITQAVSIALNYGHAFFNKDAPINNTNVNSGIVTTGSVAGRAADVVGMTFKVAQ